MMPKSFLLLFLLLTIIDPWWLLMRIKLLACPAGEQGQGCCVLRFHRNFLNRFC